MLCGTCTVITHKARLLYVSVQTTPRSFQQISQKGKPNNRQKVFVTIIQQHFPSVHLWIMVMQNIATLNYLQATEQAWQPTLPASYILQ
jgi:hypothetical protein